MQLTKKDLQIFKIASTDDSRPILRTVQFKRVKVGGKWFIRLAATDSYRLAEKYVEVPENKMPSFNVVLFDRARLEDVCKLMKPNDKVEVGRHKFKIYSKLGELKQEYPITPFVDAEYVKYEDIIKRTEEATAVARVTVQASYLKELCEQFDRDITIEVRGKLDPVIITGKVEYSTEVKSILMPLKS